MWTIKRKSKRYYAGNRVNMLTEMFYTADDDEEEYWVMGWGCRTETGKYFWQNTNDLGMDTDAIEDVMFLIKEVIEVPGCNGGIVLLGNDCDVDTGEPIVCADDCTVTGASNTCPREAVVVGLKDCHSFPLTKREIEIYETYFGKYTKKYRE